MTIRAIIFDCFGVLVSGSLEQFISKHLAHDATLVRRAHELNDQASLGLISYEDQIMGFAEMAKIPAGEVHKEMDKNPRNEALLAYIETHLYGKYKIGFPSNASDNWLDDLFLKKDLELFDDFVLSYSVKLAKPDPLIYELAANRLNVEPSECVFVDDIERYCEGATAVGMQAIQYSHMQDFKLKLEELTAHCH